MVAQRNPLYSAISLIGVFIALACLYLTLSAPFIAAVQVIVYAGAIMVLVVFVIMLLNVEEEERQPIRMRYLLPVAIVLAGVLVAEASFILFYVQTNPSTPRSLVDSDVGLTAQIGAGLFTRYLLPFEITSILLLMAIVGAMSLARRTGNLPTGARVIPGALVLPKDVIDPLAVGDATPVVAETTGEAAHILGFDSVHGKRDND
jgi:NADH-quinone oxidoreductase subunit J